jgi:selenocysteine-specific elongation factor
LKSARYQPPAPAELAASLGARPDRMQAVFELLVDRGEVRLVARDFFLTAELHEAARAAIVENCTRNGSLDIPSLRDLLGTTRKYLIPLLEHFDTQGLTLRQGGNRVLKRR